MKILELEKIGILCMDTIELKNQNGGSKEDNICITNFSSFPSGIALMVAGVKSIIYKIQGRC